MRYIWAISHNYFYFLATIKVYHDFFSYSGGIYRHTDLSVSQRTGYHSVRIVGWGEEVTYKGVEKYWVCKITKILVWGLFIYFSYYFCRGLPTAGVQIGAKTDILGLYGVRMNVKLNRLFWVCGRKSNRGLSIMKYSSKQHYSSG